MKQAILMRAWTGDAAGSGHRRVYRLTEPYREADWLFLWTSKGGDNWSVEACHDEHECEFSSTRLVLGSGMTHVAALAGMGYEEVVP